MNNDVIPLCKLPIGKDAVVTSIHGGRGLRSRLMHMGLNEGMPVKVLHAHRFGSCIVMSGNTRLVLGHGMSRKIMVKEV